MIARVILSFLVPFLCGVATTLVVQRMLRARDARIRIRAEIVSRQALLKKSTDDELVEELSTRDLSQRR